MMLALTPDAPYELYDDAVDEGSLPADYMPPPGETVGAAMVGAPVEDRQAADNGGDGGEEGEEPAVEFDRSALAKQRLMASQARTSNFKPKAPPPREIKSADSMMSEEEKAMFAKISAKMQK